MANPQVAASGALRGCGVGTEDLVKKLVAGGADPRKKDTFGQTPYHLAEYAGNDATAKMILLLCEEHERDRKGNVEDAGIGGLC